MTGPLFEDIDRYVGTLFDLSDPALDAALSAASQAGLPDIQVSPALGKFLYILARMAGARRILEIGTLAGYSTIWLARALPPGGRLTTLEYNPGHADVARANIEGAGFGAQVEVLTGAALDTLPALAEREDPPYDMAFLDADKNNYPAYLEWSLRLVRPGGVIVADNVVREGRVLDAGSADPVIRGVRAFNEALAGDERVDATILQTVGEKGHDGIAIAVIRD